jgi:hypothetical protein
MMHVIRSVVAIVCFGGLVSGVGCMAQRAPEGGAGESAAPNGAAEEASHGSTGTGTSTACAHTTCNFGVALSSSCSPCATLTCLQDPYCCDARRGAWDMLCVQEAQGDCGSLPRPPLDCNSCPSPSRTLCATGAAFDYGCPGFCIQPVCNTRPSCCSGTWDATCVELAEDICGIECEAPVR